MNSVKLKKLESIDRNQFILDNQLAFKYGAMEEFGLRDSHMEEEGEIISRETIEKAIDNGQAYRIVKDGEFVGGVVVRIEGDRGDLELLFVKPEAHSRGIGYKAWCEVEKMFPDVRVWETCTPYFEKRNIHFYVNRCGFHIVEFFNQYHKSPMNDFDGNSFEDDDSDGMFRFEKTVGNIENLL